MLLLYDLGIWLYSLLISLAALTNRKARAWIEGRRNWRDTVRRSLGPEQKRVWFHFASLGEFEQGRPVLEAIKVQRPDLDIVITFFSPSGYELRKDYPHAANVFYLPVDTKANADDFLEMLQPEFAVFTKYEFWYHYFNTLKRRAIPLFLISGLFRPTQAFFKWYGTLHREMLRNVSHFFVQTEESKALLSGIDVHNVSVSGDTRFDRVVQNKKNCAGNAIVEAFAAQTHLFIAGSTWMPDEKLIAELAATYTDWKFLIAPHDVSPSRINEIGELFPDAVRYTTVNSETNLNSTRILILDTIGLLSSVYQYGQLAYIGGGFGVGIHNIQEAAAFDLPVIFGPRYTKFQEARDLVERGAAFSVRNAQDLQNVMAKLADKGRRTELGKLAGNYITESAGATDRIINFLKENSYL